MSEVHRPLPIRKRTDLIAERLRFGVETSWIVKDPLALRFFRFQEEEYAVLALLDGRRTLAEIRDAFEAEFAPQRIQAENISRFIAQLHRQGLVISDLADQGARLLERRTEQRSRERKQRWSNPLAVRFRGIDPQRILNCGEPWVRWMFSRWAVALFVTMMLTSLAMVAIRWDVFLEKLPSHRELFTPSTVLLLMATLGAVKILHEFGHGFACRHFGGRCHELGMMFLVLTPCLYCNVTDSWRFSNKWHRIFVSAAGMYVELILAAIAAFGWWFSTPGPFHYLCLSIMFVCSVNTILFNGNPLLRYDGYYILADFVEVPNFAAKASAVFRSLVERSLCRSPEIEDPLLPRRNRFWFCTYHIVSTMYRWALTLSIILILMSVAKPYHLENLVRILALTTIAPMVIGPLKNVFRWSKAKGNEVVKLRAVLTGSIIVAALIAILAIPLPKRVWGTLEIEPQDALRVYVDVPGRLIEQAKRPGAIVRSGDVIARLAAPELESQIVDLAAKRDRFEARLKSLERERFSDPTASLRIPEVQRSIEATRSQWQEKRSEAERLTLKSTRDGTLLPAPTTAGEGATRDRLERWSGRPHDRENLGCSLTAGTLYCEVGDPHRWEALVVVEQDDLPFVRLKLPVEIKIDELPDVVFHGTVDEIAQHELTETSRHLTNKTGGEIATQTDSSGAEVPVEKSYQLKVRFEDPEGLLRFGLRGFAKIHVEPEPIGVRAWRWCRRTFHFDL